jgi:hypothetical protein
MVSVTNPPEFQISAGFQDRQPVQSALITLLEDGDRLNQMVDSLLEKLHPALASERDKITEPSPPIDGESPLIGALGELHYKLTGVIVRLDNLYKRVEL